MQSAWRCPSPLKALFVGALIACSGASVGHGAAAFQPAGANDLATAPLRARVGPPDGAVIKAYVDAGAQDAKPHALTDEEWILIDRAIAELPPLHQRILRRHLARLSFVDAPSSAGTALTRELDGQKGDRLFDITIRADVLRKSLSDFLTAKEASLFDPDGSGYSVHLSAGTAPALTYLLLHEATHVVDRTLGVTPHDGPSSKLWVGPRVLAEPYATSSIGNSAFRRGPRTPISQAPALYAALVQSPFVSMYSTAAAGEDLAELVAWSQLSSRFQVPLVIEVRDGAGRRVFHAEPLKSSAVRARFKAVEALLANPPLEPLGAPLPG
jgi:uncharacterized protein (UPF0216 family)